MRRDRSCVHPSAHKLFSSLLIVPILPSYTKGTRKLSKLSKQSRRRHILGSMILGTVCYTLFMDRKHGDDFIIFHFYVAWPLPNASSIILSQSLSSLFLTVMQNKHFLLEVRPLAASLQKDANRHISHTKINRQKLAQGMFPVGTKVR